MFTNYLLLLFVGVDHSIRRKAVNLSDEHKLGDYFALEVLQIKDGEVQKQDKELVASLLNTSL